MDNMRNLSVVDVWVYNYLIERGLTHSSFVFKKEACIEDSKVRGAATGHLLRLIEQGLLYSELESEIIQEMGSGISVPNGEPLIFDESKIYSYIDQRLGGRTCEPASGENIILERADSNLTNGHSKGHYKIHVHETNAVVLDVDNSKLYLINLLDDGHMVSKPFQICLGNILPLFKIFFHENICFYDEHGFVLCDYKNNFRLLKVYSIKESGNKIKRIDSTDNFFVLSFSEAPEKLIFTSDGELAAKLDGNMKIIEVDNSLLLCYFDSSDIVRFFGPESVENLRYITEERLTLVDVCVNSKKTIIAAYYINNEIHKGVLYFWMAHQAEFIYSISVKENFQKIAFDKDDFLIISGQQQIKVFDIQLAESIYSETFDSKIKHTENLGDSKLLIELFGNRFKKIDWSQNSSVEIDKSSSLSYMYACPAVKRILEFENLETFKFIDL
jgi:hypothetical protein